MPQLGMGMGMGMGMGQKWQSQMGRVLAANASKPQCVSYK